MAPDTIMGTYDLEKKVEDTVILIEMTRQNYGDANRAVMIEEAVQELMNAKMRITEANRFAIVSFGEKSDVLLDFDNWAGVEPAMQAIYDKAKLMGDKALLMVGLNAAFQCVVKSMQKLAEGKVFRILIISEGVFAPEKGDWTQLTDVASKIGLYIDAIKIGQNQDVTLKRITRSTEGDYVECNLKEIKSWLPSFAAVKKKTNINQTDKDKNSKALLELIAAPLKTIREQIQTPKDLLKLVVSEDQTVKCGICYSLNCMICKGPPYACGAFCPNCNRFFHVHCAAAWSENSKDMPTNVFKCPICFSLLKVPGAVYRVKVLQSRLKDSFVPPTDRVEMIKVKASELGTNWKFETCAKCHAIFNNPEDEVLICGNKDCGARYHPDCIDEIEKSHQGRCRVCDVNIRRKFDAVVE